MSFFGKIRQLWRGVDVSDTYAFLQIGKHDFEPIRSMVLGIVESSHFSKRILFVAASGFFTGGYTIFSTNVVAPALAYVYWPDHRNGDRSLGINIATLIGSCFGMVLFGYLADCFGRKRLYGVELVVVIAATLGLTQASAGYDNKSMSVYGWICFWRTLLGIGVGAEYPLSALIASEWSSTEHRGTMLVAVFLMQPLSQLTAQGIGLGALRGISASHNLSRDEKSHETAAPVIDSVWRLVIGVGAAPALLAIIGRMTIPETPRFLLEIERDASAALQSTTEVYSGSTPGSTTAINTAASLQERNRPTFTASESNSREDSAGPSSHKEFYGPARATTEQILRQDARANTIGQQSAGSGEGTRPNPTESLGQLLARVWTEVKHFMRSKYGPILLATSFCWFLLDICYYGLGLDNPNLLGKIWLEKLPSDEESYNATRPYDWNSNSLSHKDTQAIYRVLEGNFLRALYTTAPASVCGCLLFLLIVNRVPRVRFMVCIFMMLAAIFAILGGTLFSVYATNHHDVTVVFYAISLFLINLGPNTITFLLPAELFETKNRGTCYGIAAASGKLGAIVVQIVIWRIKAGGTEKEPLAGLLLAFTPLMLLGALTAWVWIPEVQDPVENKAGQIKQFSVFSNRPLEKIAENVTLDQVVGIRNKLGHLVRKKTE
jgi:PHS family inorganic phosphate transporter-like MFS transporter